MSQATMTSRDFNQDVSRAKRVAEAGPVVITDRGEPAYVLLTYERYQRLLGKQPSVRVRLAQSTGRDVEFEAPRLRDLALKVPHLT